MTCTDASRTEFKSWKTFMMPSTACVSLSFVTSTDSGSRSDNPCRRSCPFLKSRLTPDKFRIMVLGTGQTLLGHLEQETVEYCFPFSYLHDSTSSNAKLGFVHVSELRALKLRLYLVG